MKETTWQESIEILVDKRLAISGVNKETMDELREKRKKGHEKYGDKAYQASFEAFMAIDFLQNGKEEILDLMNYLVLYKIWLDFKGVSGSEVGIIDMMIEDTNRLIYRHDHNLTRS